MACKPLHVVTDDDQPTAPAMPRTILEAAESGSRLDELRAMRRRLEWHGVLTGLDLAEQAPDHPDNGDSGAQKCSQAAVPGICLQPRSQAL